jgi:DNA-binding transcriptional ArsR family regulator
MGDSDFKILNALSNETRLMMFKYLSEKDMHISKVARILKVSIPVASKHAVILEDADLIHRKIFGKTHVLSIKNKKLCQLEDEPEASVSSDYQKILTTIESLKALNKVEKID